MSRIDVPYTLSVLDMDLIVTVEVTHEEIEILAVGWDGTPTLWMVEAEPMRSEIWERAIEQLGAAEEDGRADAEERKSGHPRFDGRAS